MEDNQTSRLFKAMNSPFSDAGYMCSSAKQPIMPTTITICLLMWFDLFISFHGAHFIAVICNIYIYFSMIFSSASVHNMRCLATEWLL